MRRMGLGLVCVATVASPASAQQPVGVTSPGVRCIAERAGGQLVKITGDALESRITPEQFASALDVHLVTCGQQLKWEYGSQRQSATTYARTTGIIDYFGARLRASKVDPVTILALHGRISSDLRSLLGRPPRTPQLGTLIDEELEKFVKANSEAKTLPTLGWATTVLRAEVERRDAIANYQRISEQIRQQNATAK